MCEVLDFSVEVKIERQIPSTDSGKIVELGQDVDNGVREMQHSPQAEDETAEVERWSGQDYRVEKLKNDYLWRGLVSYIIRDQGQRANLPCSQLSQVDVADEEWRCDGLLVLLGRACRG